MDRYKLKNRIVNAAGRRADKAVRKFRRRNRGPGPGLGPGPALSAAGSGRPSLCRAGVSAGFRLTYEPLGAGRIPGGRWRAGKALYAGAWFPMYPTFSHYARLLFETPQFFTVFWNSMKIAVCSVGGQLLLAVPAAWAFAVYRFPMRKLLFTLMWC